jgi:hypothetical protein
MPTSEFSRRQAAASATVIAGLPGSVPPGRPVPAATPAFVTHDKDRLIAFLYDVEPDAEG